MLQHYVHRGLEKGRNIACNIAYNKFQWRWLQAESIRATRTGNMVSKLPAILYAAFFSGGRNLLQHYVQRGLETLFQLAVQH